MSSPSRCGGRTTGRANAGASGSWRVTGVSAGRELAQPAQAIAIKTTASRLRTELVFQITDCLLALSGGGLDRLEAFGGDAGAEQRRVQVLLGGGVRGDFGLQRGLG